MSLFLPEFVLEVCSYSLVEHVVRTTVAAAVYAGIQTVIPGSMQGIYVGAMVIVDAGTLQEIVTVTSTTTGSFTAVFSNNHSPGVSVVGATFPSGQPNTPMWTQAEMLNYLALTQNEFLCAVRPVYAIASQPITASNATYPIPSNAIRVERISQDGTELWNTTRTDIDWQGGYSTRSPQQPQFWYQDKVGPFNFSLDPCPQVNDSVRLFYSISASTSLGLLTPFIVPDLFWPALKYGTLAQAFTKDSEQKDMSRGIYCHRKFEFWILLARKFLDGLDARIIGSEETVEPLLAQMRGGK